MSDCNTHNNNHDSREEEHDSNEECLRSCHDKTIHDCGLALQHHGSRMTARVAAMRPSHNSSGGRRAAHGHHLLTRLSSKEVDELYEMVEVTVGFLDELDIPYIFHSGTLLGAMRSQSILFNDDDVDIAIFSNGYPRLLVHLPKLLRECDRKDSNHDKSDNANHAAQSVKEDDSSGAPNKGRQAGQEPQHARRFFFQERPWMGCDRIRSSRAPRVWMDVFVLRRYETLKDVEAVVWYKDNGDEQLPSYREEIVRQIPSTAYPLYHYDNRKAMELWPCEYLCPCEVFPLATWHKGGGGGSGRALGHLTRVKTPANPVAILNRFFGADWWSHYTPHATRATSFGAVAWKKQVKEALQDLHYTPILSTSRAKRDSMPAALTRWSRQELLCRLEPTLWQPPTVSRNHEASDATLTHEQNDEEDPLPTKGQEQASNQKEPESSSLSLSQPPQQTLCAKRRGARGGASGKRYFGADMRQATGGSSGVPDFDSPILGQVVMPPHIAKARRNRQEALAKAGLTEDAVKCHCRFFPFCRQVSIRYNAFQYPLARILRQVLLPQDNDDDLAQLHKKYPAPQHDKSILMQPLLDAQQRRPFDECFRRFILEHFLPQVLHPRVMSVAQEEGENVVYYYRYQAFPCLRVIRPHEFSIGPHCDGAYGHSMANWNVHMPLTPTAGTNALYTESSPCREDWHALLSDGGGEAFVFYGSSCLHFTLENTTDQTRVSLDFRVAPFTGVVSKNADSLESKDHEAEGNQVESFQLLREDSALLQDAYTKPPGYYHVARMLRHVDAHGRCTWTAVRVENDNDDDDGARTFPDKRVGFPFCLPKT